MSYIGIPPFGQTVRTVTTITASASQTSFTPNGGYTVGYVDVYYNGIKLVGGVDFTASNGTTVVLTAGATANAVVEIVTYGSVSLADSVRRSGDTFSGTVNFPNNNIIAANGFIGIGNTIPNAPLVIGSASGAFTNPLVQAAGSANSWVQISAQNLNNGNNASTDLVLGRSDGNDTTKFIDVGINSNTYAQAAYSIMTPGSGYVFVNGGDLSLGTQTNNSILFHTGNTTAASERMRITDSVLSLTGLQGIKFQANQASSSDANTLDDYEEGTWTVTDQSGAGLTLSVGSTARYRKVGSLVFVVFYVTWPTNSNSSEAKFSLPFQAGGAYCYLTGRFQNSAKAGTTGFVSQIQADLSYGVINSSTNSATTYTNAELSGQYVLLSGCYISAS